MSKFSVDYTKLESNLSKKAYKLSDVKDRLETVAFDVVRFKDGDKGAALWQIQSADDGDYIVTLYSDEEAATTKMASLPWEVVLSKTTKELNVFYKGDPIAKVAAAKLGLPEKEIGTVEKYLPRKLAENKKLVKALLNDLDEPTKNSVLFKYPELA